MDEYSRRAAATASADAIEGSIAEDNASIIASVRRFAQAFEDSLGCSEPEKKDSTFPRSNS
jgi:hypothetical protein